MGGATEPVVADVVVGGMYLAVDGWCKEMQGYI